jgi:hypothetical protein
MDAQLQRLLDKLVKSQFAELKGSRADLHLQLPEKLVNEAIAMLLASQRDANPWLALVSAAQVKGSITVDLKLNV